MEKRMSEQLREAAKRNVELMDQIHREQEAHLQERVDMERRHRMAYDEVHMSYLGCRNDLTQCKVERDALQRKADRMERKLKALQTAGAIGLMVFVGAALVTACFAAEGHCSWIFPISMLAAAAWNAMMGGWTA